MTRLICSSGLWVPKGLRRKTGFATKKTIPNITRCFVPQCLSATNHQTFSRSNKNAYIHMYIYTYAGIVQLAGHSQAELLRPHSNNKKDCSNPSWLHTIPVFMWDSSVGCYSTLVCSILSDSSTFLSHSLLSFFVFRSGNFLLIFLDSHGVGWVK